MHCATGGGHVLPPCRSKMGLCLAAGQPAHMVPHRSRFRSVLQVVSCSIDSLRCSGEGQGVVPCAVIPDQPSMAVGDCLLVHIPQIDAFPSVSMAGMIRAIRAIVCI